MNQSLLEVELRHMERKSGNPKTQLEKAVKEYKNVGQTMVTAPFNSTKESLAIVQKYDAEITKAAKEHGMEKEMV